LDVLVFFVETFEKSLKEESSLIDSVFHIIKLLLGSQSELFIGNAYLGLAWLVYKLRKPLFAFKKTNYCQDLIYEIIKHCNIPNAMIRNRAACVLFLMMRVRKKNFHDSHFFF
jgi:hypothetical protein